jgi:transposase
VKKWCCEFSEGRTDVHDGQRSGRPSLISDDLLQKIEAEVLANRRGTTIHEARTIAHH